MLTGPLTFTLDFTDPTVDYDAILEDELESAANEEFVDSDLLTGPQVPEHTLKTHSFRYAYLFAISGMFWEYFEQFSAIIILLHKWNKNIFFFQMDSEKKICWV